MQASVDWYVCETETGGGYHSGGDGAAGAQRSVVALAVRSWMRLVLQFLQSTCPSRG